MQQADLPIVHGADFDGYVQGMLILIQEIRGNQNIFKHHTFLKKYYNFV
jgi:hypothetical protein